MCAVYEKSVVGIELDHRSEVGVCFRMMVDYMDGKQHVRFGKQDVDI